MPISERGSHLVTRRALLAAMSVAGIRGDVALGSGAPLHSPFQGIKSPPPSADPNADGSRDSIEAVGVVRSLNVPSRYSDAAGTVVDPHRSEIGLAAVAPLRRFVKIIEGCTEAWLGSGGARGDAKEAALQLLSCWAKGGGLVGNFDDAARGARWWNTSGFATAYLALTSSFNNQTSPVLAPWFLELGIKCADTAEHLENNLLNWGASSSMACSIAANDRNLFERSAKMARKGIAQIGPDGRLPAELARGRLSDGYHSFALAALLLCAELALPNGINLYNDGQGAIARLVRYNLSRDDGLNVQRLPWLVIWARRFPDPTLQAVLDRDGVVRYAYLGGNVTALFGA